MLLLMQINLPEISGKNNDVCKFNGGRCIICMYCKIFPSHRKNVLSYLPFRNITKFRKNVISRYLLYNFKTEKMGMSLGFFQTLFIYLFIYLYLGFLSHDIHDLQEKRGRWRLILAPVYATSTPFANTSTLAGRSLQKAHLCT